MEKYFHQKQVDSIVEKFNNKEDPNQKIVENIINKFNKKENNIVESVKQLSPEKRLSKLIELGTLRDIEGYEWGCLGGDRFYVFANINGVPIPMYRSSAHTGGKRSDLEFFPFFGTQAKSQDWLIKGDTHRDTDTFYGIKSLEETSKILTEVFNFNTDRVKKVHNESYRQGVDSPWDKEKDVENFVSEGKEIENSNKLNQLIGKRFNVDYDIVNSMPSYSLSVVKYISEKIFSEIK